MIDTHRGAPGAGPVAVLGATGQVGRHVVTGLEQRGVAYRALTRSPSRPGEHRVDLAQRAGLAGALAGCESMLLLTPDTDDQAEREIAALEAAVNVGIGHIVKISAQLAGLDPPVSFGIPHLQVERALRAKPVTWTLLRPTMFVQTLRMFAPDLARCRRLIAPMGRGAIAFVDVRDIAAVAVAALLRGDLAGRTLTLTGPEAVTCGQIAAMLSERLGHRVRYLSPPMALARWKLRTEHPCGQADRLADGAVALRAGAHSRPSSDVPDVLGRPARTVAAFLDEQLARLPAPMQA